MNKFRASYSVLDTWHRGDYERATLMYFKLDDFDSEAMKQGRQFHQDWAKEVSTNKKLPAVFGSKQLKNPQTELKLVVQIYDWLEFVGVIDCYDEPIIYEYKTGTAESQRYTTSKQIGMYGLLLTYSDMFVNFCEIYHYNQHSGKADMSMVHITDHLINNSLNFLITTAGEMHNYLESNNLYEKLGGKK